MGYRGNLSKVSTVTHRTQVSPLSHSGDRGNLSLEFDVETFAKMGDRGDLCFPSGIQKGPRGNGRKGAGTERGAVVEGRGGRGYLWPKACHLRCRRYPQSDLEAPSTLAGYRGNHGSRWETAETSPGKHPTNGRAWQPRHPRIPWEPFKGFHGAHSRKGYPALTLGQAPIQPQQDTGETDGIPWKPQLPMG